MTYREYNDSQRKRWVGNKVIYDGAVYNVADVDYNGALMIDKPTKFTDTTAVSIGMIQVIEEEQAMSKDWTPEELQAASEAMKAAGHMSYEDVCAELEAQEKIGRFAPLQREYHWPCPRCGRWKMDSDPVRNALSRRAQIYICDSCGVAEAMEDFRQKVTPLACWDIARKVDWPFGSEGAES